MLRDPGCILELAREHLKIVPGLQPAGSPIRLVWSGPKEVEPGLRTTALYPKVKDATPNSQGQ